MIFQSSKTDFAKKPFPRTLTPRRLHWALLCWKSFELALNLLLLVRLKLPAKPLSPNAGPALKKSLSIIQDRYFNFAFGPYTNLLRIIVVIFLSPSLVIKFLSWQQIYNVIQGSFLIFDIFGVLDIFNTTYSKIFYTLLTIIRVCRLIDLLYELAILSRNFPKQTEFEEQIPQEGKVNKTSKRQKQVKTQFYHFQLFLSRKDVDVDGSDSLQGRSNSTQDRTNYDQQSKQPIERKLVQKYPYYRLKVRTGDSESEILIKNPFEFDQSFKLFKGDAQELLMIKIHYCTLLLRSLRKKTNNKDQEIVQHYNELLSKYSSELIFLYQ